MSKLAQLREQRNAKAKAAQELNNQFPAEKRMPAAEAEKLDALLAEVEAIDKEIAREERLSKTALENLSDDDLRNRHTKDPARQENRDRNAALRAYLVGGIAGLSDAQRQELQARMTQDIRNAMSTTTNSEGGYTVATEYYKVLEVAMKSWGAILAAADTITTGSGADMNFPTADPTAEIGEIVGQNSPVSGADTTFGNIALSVYKYSSKKIALPFELINDSFIDIEGYVQEVLAMRLGRILSAHCTTGTGTGQPRGVVTGAGAGKVGTTGQTTSVIYDDLIDLEHSVDPAYRGRPGVGYMMHDNSLAKVRKLKDSNGRPIFVPGYEQGNPGGAPDRLLGRPIYINQDMATMAANAKSILFGDFKKYKVRKVMDLTVFRMTDSAFTLNGQVGFVAFNRMGGNLIDVGGAIKYYQNSAT
jgi:HK97 family phage major capsid protein